MNQAAHDAFADLVVWLMKEMSRAGLLRQSGTTLVNFMHMLCGRGNIGCVRRILAVFDRGEFTRLDRPFMIQLLNQKNKTGAGCVDAALKTKVEFAEMLKLFGAKEQRPPPEKASGGKWSTGWSWKTGTDAAASGHVEGSPWNQDTSRQDGASSSSWGGWNAGGWSAWNGGGRSWKGAARASSPEPGQYDHRGSAPEEKGLGMYAHDQRMRRYEEKADGDAPSSDESERSDS